MAIEVAIALTVLGLLAAMTAKVLSSYRQTREHYAARQAAAWAADAQLQRILAGAPIDSPPPADMLDEKIELMAHRQPGEGDWTGCDLITVTARIEQKHKHPIIETVSTYTQGEVTP